jgi:uncharacterized protein (DUF433 family)
VDLPSFLTQDEYGEIRLTGHRIGLYTLVRCYKEGMTPEQMVLEFDTLSLDQIRKVIAFYEQNRAEVEPYFEAYRLELERQEAEHQPGPGALKLRRLMERIREADRKHAGDPRWVNLSLMEKVRQIEASDPAEAV